MTGTERIGRDAEDRIIRALGDAKDLINEGLSPNDALVKAAELHDVPAGHVQLMVQAYNTGQTNRQRKDADDVLEKAGEFELANPRAVLSALYPTLNKTAGQLHDETAVDSDYLLPPLWFQRLETRTKAARQGYVQETEKVAYARDTSKQPERAHAIMADIHRMEEGLRRQASALRDKVAFEFEAVENYFRRPGCIPFDEVSDNSIRLWGKQAAELMEQVGQARYKFAKQASYRDPSPVNEKKAPYSYVRDCLQAINTYKEKTAELQEFREKMRPQAMKVARHFSPPPPSKHINLDDADDDRHLAKQAFGEGGGFLSSLMSNAAGTAIGVGIRDKALGAPNPDSLKTDAYRAVTDPGHEARIRSLQAQAGLHDMLANDEVVSGYQPEDVLRVYNEINQIAPRASTNPMLMRALIRKHLAQGQLDPFDISQLTGIETNLKDRDEPFASGDLGSVPGVRGGK